MFESVLERNLPARQIGRGATLAIGVHAVVIVAAVYLSARPVPVVEKEMRAITVFAPPSRMLSPGPAVGGEAPTPKPRSEHRAVRTTPADIDKTQKHSETPATTGEPSSDTGHPSAGPGPAVDVPGPAGGGGPPGAAGIPGGTTIAIPFGDGMKRPSPISQPPPVYTREASAAKAEGTVSVKCVITLEGTLRDCRIIRGIPFMDTAVLEALSRWKYTPATFQGHPVSVEYPINLRLVAP